jgi:asparagine synthase (glutamine-hydrolysing)
MLNTAAHSLSELVRSTGQKVVLGGQGADELFGGYVGYRFDRFKEHRGIGLTDNPQENALRAMIWGDSEYFYERNYADVRDLKGMLYSDNIRGNYNEIDCYRHFIIDCRHIEGRHPFHKRSYIDFRLRLADHLLSDHGDRMTFAHAVEGRYPYLDKRLVEYVSKLHPNEFLHGYLDKQLLRTVAEPLIPAAIAQREKVGFSVPGTPTLLSQRSEYIEDILSPSRIRRQGFFDERKVTELITQCRNGEYKINVPYEADLLAIIITFQMFLDVFEMPGL